MLELQDLCPLGSCEMVLLTLSRGSKVYASLFRGSHITGICDTYLIAALSGPSIWHKNYRVHRPLMQHCGGFNLGSTDTAETFALAHDG